MVYAAGPAFLLAFQGFRLFVKSLSIKTILASWPFSLALVIAGWALLALLPHTAMPDEMVFDFTQITYVIIAVYTALTSLLGFKIMRQVTSRYAQAVGWLAAAFGIVSSLRPAPRFGLNSASATQQVDPRKARFIGTSCTRAIQVTQIARYAGPL